MLCTRAGWEHRWKNENRGTRGEKRQKRQKRQACERPGRTHFLVRSPLFHFLSRQLVFLPAAFVVAVAFSRNMLLLLLLPFGPVGSAATRQQATPIWARASVALAHRPGLCIAFVLPSLLFLTCVLLALRTSSLVHPSCLLPTPPAKS